MEIKGTGTDEIVYSPICLATMALPDSPGAAQTVHCGSAVETL